MFNNNRYLTCGIDSTIPLELQLFLWNCVDELPKERDYLQVFKLEPFGEMQRITHTSENPEHKMEYLIPSENPEHKMEYLIPSEKPIAEKIYIIDDGDHSTMLLAEEY